MSFQSCLKIDRDPAFRIGVGRSFHQPGTVNENVLETDLCLRFDCGLMEVHPEEHCSSPARDGYRNSVFNRSRG